MPPGYGTTMRTACPPPRNPRADPRRRRAACERPSPPFAPGTRPPGPAPRFECGDSAVKRPDRRAFPAGEAPRGNPLVHHVRILPSERTTRSSTFNRQSSIAPVRWRRPPGYRRAASCEQDDIRTYAGKPVSIDCAVSGRLLGNCNPAAVNQTPTDGKGLTVNVAAPSA